MTHTHNYAVKADIYHTSPDFSGRRNTVCEAITADSPEQAAAALHRLYADRSADDHTWEVITGTCHASRTDRRAHLDAAQILKTLDARGPD